MTYAPHTVFASTGNPFTPLPGDKKRGRMSQEQVWQWVLQHPRTTSQDVKAAMEAESDNCVRRMLLEHQKAGKISKTYDRQIKTYRYSERTPDDPSSYKPRTRMVRRANGSSSGCQGSPGHASVTC